MQSIRNKNQLLRSSYLSLLSKQQQKLTLSTTNHKCVNENWNPIARQRNTDVGKHVFEAFAVRTLIDNHPELDAGEIHDVTQGIIFKLFSNFFV